MSSSTPIKCQWVYNIKSDSCKHARLVAKGFSQIPGVDYNETFPPVSRFESVHILLAVAALEDWEIKSINVKTAFLYGDLAEEIYMVQPEGFTVNVKRLDGCLIYPKYTLIAVAQVQSA